jgi:hypothetical protein
MSDERKVSPNGSDPALVDAIIHESEQVQSGIERAQNGIYTSFGVVLPAVFGLFLFFTGDKRPQGIPAELVALLFIMAISLGALWSQNLWMELFRYTNYKHTVLLPRLYEATNQNGRTNFLQTTPRSALMALPVNLFNVGVLVALIGAHAAFVGLKAPYSLISAGFIGSAVLSTFAVMIEAAKLGVAIQRSTAQDDAG